MEEEVIAKSVTKGYTQRTILTLFLTGVEDLDTKAAILRLLMRNSPIQQSAHALLQGVTEIR